MTKRDDEKAEAREALRRYIRRGSTVRTVIRHVSRSGMSRSIDLYTVHKGDLVCLTYWAGKLLGMRHDNKNGGLKIGGCGMDMGFAIVNNLSYAMFNGLEETRKERPGVTPGRYKANGKEWHAGYELRQEWI